MILPWLMITLNSTTLTMFLDLDIIPINNSMRCEGFRINCGHCLMCRGVEKGWLEYSFSQQNHMYWQIICSLLFGVLFHCVGMIQVDAQEKPNSLGMHFVVIEAGEFVMGNEKSVDEIRAEFPMSNKDWLLHADPAHTVRISKPFALSRYETTVRQFKEFAVEVLDKRYAESAEGVVGGGYNAEKREVEFLSPNYSWKNTGWNQSDEHPVVNVTKQEALDFCVWLSRKEALQYRLPTEAEWEFAFRGGSRVYFSNGSDVDKVRQIGNIRDRSCVKMLPFFQWWADYDDKFPFTAPVGSFAPDTRGLYDMTGNVNEICSDWYGSDYYASSPKSDPHGAVKGEFGVMRGGSWFSHPASARGAVRGPMMPEHRHCSTGFRVVREVAASNAAIDPSHR